MARTILPATIATQGERRRGPDLLPHFILVIAVAVFAFPIYVAIVGSTHDASTISRGRMPCCPGHT
jgi:sn-glycerol 3-phosphate transport system permease protein